MSNPLTFSQYQNRSKDTDHLDRQGNDALQVALLGLTGEAGSLHTLYKKLLRDGPSFPNFKDRVREELGDTLWYLSAIASHEGLSLEEIAVMNLQKTASRWLPTDLDDPSGFDSNFSPSESLPISFIAEFRPRRRKPDQIEVFIDGEKWGNSLKDNSYVEDGYRFHDVFHMACAAMLGWSPVFRALLRRKRKSEPKIDEVEDGGRAIVTEEAISLFVFSHAKRQRYFEGIQFLDAGLLDTCVNLTGDHEVARCSRYDWEQAILAAYGVWRKLMIHNGGKIMFDVANRSVTFLGKKKPARKAAVSPEEQLALPA